MKEIKLSKGKVAFVNDSDYERVNQFKWTTTESKNNDGVVYYAYRNVSNKNGVIKSIKLHQFILGEAPEGMIIDHKNGNGLDNRRRNLRFCTKSQNAQNSKKTAGKSIYKGVSWNKYRSRWVAYIRFDNRHIYLGSSKIEKEMAVKYDIAAKLYFGDFAKINFKRDRNSKYTP